MKVTGLIQAILALLAVVPAVAVKDESKTPRNLLYYGPSPTAPTAPAPKCRDYKGWKDAMRKGCRWYEKKPASRCKMADHLAKKGWPGAKEACCVCGGGKYRKTHPPTEAPTPGPTEEPTPAPTTPAPSAAATPQPTYACKNKRNWMDKKKKTCEWYELKPKLRCKYARQWAPVIGGYGGYGGGKIGLSAQETCCVCGGGFTKTNPPTIPPAPTCTPSTAPSTSAEPSKAPTDAPTPAPTPKCYDRTRWHDSKGRGCNWYKYGYARCTKADKWANKKGVSAKVACCACGGGGTTPYRGGYGGGGGNGGYGGYHRK